MPQGETKITVAQATNALRGIEMLPPLRGKPGYWMGRFGQMIEAIVTGYQKAQRRLELRYSDGKRDEKGNFVIEDQQKKTDFEDELQKLLDIEEVLPLNAIKYEDIVKEFENDKDEDGKKKPFEIQPRVLRLLGPIIVSSEKDDAAARAFVPKIAAVEERKPEPAGDRTEEQGDGAQDEGSGD